MRFPPRKKNRTRRLSTHIHPKADMVLVVSTRAPFFKDVFLLINHVCSAKKITMAEKAVDLIPHIC